LEVEAALKSKAAVIPILVADATMPKASELPSELAALTRLNAQIRLTAAGAMTLRRSSLSSATSRPGRERVN
jgi:hypothetical protein